jgi:hypothetical protein
MYSQPLAYFITFTTRDSWLHGDERGSFRCDGDYITSASEQQTTENSVLKNPPLIFSPNFTQRTPNIRRWLAKILRHTEMENSRH